MNELNYFDSYASDSLFNASNGQTGQQPSLSLPGEANESRPGFQRDPGARKRFCSSKLLSCLIIERDSQLFRFFTYQQQARVV